MIKPRKAVMEMEEYKPPTSGRENYLKMDFNENTLGCSPKVLSALRKLKASDLSAYPEYYTLRMALARYCKVNFNEILPTNATDEAIKTVIETYMEKGKDEIIIPVPTFAMFKFYAQLNEAIIKEIEYSADLNFPAKKILAEINKKTKIVVLVNPNNPTGTSIRSKDIIKILEKAKENGSIVLIDEAYFQFYGKTSIPLIKKYGNLIVLRTFSKAFVLAGIRLGYAVSNKENIKSMQKVLSPYSVNSIASACALAAIRDTDYVKNYVKEVSQSKKIVYAFLDEVGIKYYKSDANFILVNVGKKSAYFCKKLKECGILVRDRGSDPLLEGCVRITLGTAEQANQMIKAVREAIKELNPLLIFDIDGVLVDVSNSYRTAARKTAEYFTRTKISFEEIQDYKNKGGLNNDWDLTEAIIRSKGKSANKSKIIAKFQSYYKRLINNERWLLDKKLLGKLSKRYNLAILTGRPRKEAIYVLNKNKVIDYFKVIAAMEDVSKQKPNPEGLLKILNQFANSSAYYFGDTTDDMESAISANITPIGVIPPQDKSAFLKNLLIKKGASSVIKDINKIVEVIK